MKKPEIVCAIGSAVLAPVGIMLLMAIGVLIWRLAPNFYVPDWLGWTCTIVAVALIVYLLIGIYLLLFRHCRERMLR